MRYSIILYCTFAFMAAGLFGFAIEWNPRADYDKIEKVYATRCRECGYPSSPGVIARDELCEQRGPLCVSGWFEEKRGVAGVLAALVKNRLLLGSAMILISFVIISRLKARQKPIWGPLVMAAFAAVFFVSALILFFYMEKRIFAWVCLFLFAAALGSYKLQGGGFVQEPDAVPK